MALSKFGSYNHFIIISLLISMMYYRKGNRDELLMSVKFTPTQPDVMKIVEKLTEK